ncbi:hypothetical protein TBS_10250 [Thermobispora bispora]|jgi:hypothetical protein|uniref:Uncharacterized protein n=1 Tax=Thermobispora bispora (strain ATCC 19993 / DSM 43833 / CBS 139.67 / JCM 10125 / KCTC 9307 / NBRC 14880 / R51) TaxID=469371 RepID=D6Y1X0_THEBD|nr:hypothetical protein [Thermobispora bispora]ADG88726.1 hypothetical protein Tbis_2014 [Thermobispora bispora DSM 43833]MBO2474538.1 hypothetical protein [Actinomycetales bacterium]MBX6168890.1 hypothetical protein [Thermobispora bispora]QSI48500.1 hypothetical protein CYL17_12035 [Thermobispora bispora]
MTDSGGAPRTGEPADGIAAVLAPLERLGDTPVSGHVAIFEEVLAGLEAVLASVGEPGPDAP